MRCPRLRDLEVADSLQVVHISSWGARVRLFTPRSTSTSAWRRQVSGDCCGGWCFLRFRRRYRPHVDPFWWGFRESTWVGWTAAVEPCFVFFTLRETGGNDRLLFGGACPVRCGLLGGGGGRARFWFCVSSVFAKNGILGVACLVSFRVK